MVRLPGLRTGFSFAITVSGRLRLVWLEAGRPPLSHSFHSFHSFHGFHSFSMVSLQFSYNFYNFHNLSTVSTIFPLLSNSFYSLYITSITFPQPPQSLYLLQPSSYFYNNQSTHYPLNPLSSLHLHLYK